MCNVTPIFPLNISEDTKRKDLKVTHQIVNDHFPSVVGDI